MRAQSVRTVAAVGAAGSAILYYLIGFGMLAIGKPANGGEADLLGFGLVMGTLFLGLAAITLFVTNRWVLGAVAVLDALTVVGYFVAASVREPPFEVWGLTIKALQVAMLIAIGLLLFASRKPREAGPAEQVELATKAGVS